MNHCQQRHEGDKTQEWTGHAMTSHVSLYHHSYSYNFLMRTCHCLHVSYHVLHCAVVLKLAGDLTRIYLVSSVAAAAAAAAVVTARMNIQLL